MDWRAFKRAYGSADKLLLAMAAMDAAKVPGKRLSSLLQLFANPVLSQSVLRPVSAAVARVANWVHVFAETASSGAKLGTTSDVGSASTCVSLVCPAVPPSYAHTACMRVLLSPSPCMRCMGCCRTADVCPLVVCMCALLSPSPCMRCMGCCRTADVCPL